MPNNIVFENDGFRLVMPGLVPAIHFFFYEKAKTWMPGTRPGMTSLRSDRSRFG
jgi:hypothetical protein